MIRIDRPALEPVALQTGIQLVQAKIASHDTDPPLFTTRHGKFTFNAAVYGDEAVRDVLKTAQHWKCCFCESKIEHVSYGEIEHFRPKAAWRQESTSPLMRPGYYWLAYSWTNLLWSCKVCNGTHKKNLFPLQAPETRDCAGRSIANEDPLLVDPTICNPRDHIRFKLEKAIAVSDMGSATIEAVGLNRELLLIERRKRLQELILLWDNIEMARELGRTSQVVSAERTLANAVLPRSAYSSMAIDLLAGLAEGDTAQAA